MLLHEVGVGFAGNLFDDLAEHVIAAVRIFETFAGRKTQRQAGEKAYMSAGGEV